MRLSLFFILLLSTVSAWASWTLNADVNFRELKLNIDKKVEPNKIFVIKRNNYILNIVVEEVIGDTDQSVRFRINIDKFQNNQTNKDYASFLHVTKLNTEVFPAHSDPIVTRFIVKENLE